MFVIDVIPLARGTQLESLSYFAAHEYAPGTFLQVPVRGKQIPAIVIESKPVSNSKTSLKSATFSLRKLPEQKPLGSVPDSLLETARTLSERLPAKTGSVLYHLLPPDVRNGSRPYPSVSGNDSHEESIPLILCATQLERYVSYRSHIRTTLAHRGSVLFVVPTSSDVFYAAKHLSAGIEERIITFAPAQTKRERDKAYTAFDDYTTAKVIITTPSHAYLERSDLLSIIIEKAASDQFKTRSRPYLDHKEAIITLARVSNRSVVLGDLVHKAEDEQYRRLEHLQTIEEYPKRLAFSSSFSIITQKDKPTTETPFELFSADLLRAVEHALDARGHIFLHSARRGLAPVVACFDCGYIFRCPDSQTPFSLLRTYKNGTEERWFISSTSGRRIHAADVCDQCGSWRLRERGIGIQHIHDEFKKKFPNITPVIFDHTTATTHKRAEKLIGQFYDQKGSVLIGTSMCLPYLTAPVDLSAIVSLDAARTIPTWRADEMLFGFLMRLRELTTGHVLIQTRTDTDDLLTYASRGSLERFFDDELKLRSMLKYPPFATIILLTYRGSEAAITKIEDIITPQLRPYEPRYYSHPSSTSKKTVRHALMRVPNDQWPHQQLLGVLKHLPPYIAVEVNPDRIV